MDKVYHFSAPGRTEIGGNHTDHQHGCVIAAAVDMTTTAEVTLNGTNVIRVDSEGYRPVEIDLSDLKIREEEKNTTAALIRGVAAAFAQRGYKLAGFDAKGEVHGAAGFRPLQLGSVRSPDRPHPERPVRRQCGFRH